MALKESIRMAQESSDDVCLQHALSWLYCLRSSRKYIEHSIIKSLDLSLSYVMSLGIQSFVQFAGLRGGDPKKIFDVRYPTKISSEGYCFFDAHCNNLHKHANQR